MKLLYLATLSAYVLCTKKPPLGPKNELKAPAGAALLTLPHSLAELCGLQVIGQVFIACHCCSAVVMLGAALLIPTPLLSSCTEIAPWQVSLRSY